MTFKQLKVAVYADGADLEYADEITLTRALEGRQIL